MAVLDRAALTAAINLAITTNGNKEITGSVLNGVLQDIADSLANLSSDITLISVNEYDPATTYNAGVGVFFEGGLYQANENTITGVFNPLKWTLITQIAGSSEFDFVPYENATTYNIGDRVLYLERFYICDANGTVGIIPDDAAAEWTEVSASTGIFAAEWVAAYYLQDTVVQHNNFFYKLVTATPPSFNSTDIDAEIIAGDWVLFHDVGGGGGTSLSAVLGTDNQTLGNDIFLNMIATIGDAIIFHQDAPNLSDLTLKAYNVNPEAVGLVNENDEAALTADCYFFLNSLAGNSALGFTFGNNSGSRGGLLCSQNNTITLDSKEALNLSSDQDINLQPANGKRIFAHKPLVIVDRLLGIEMQAYTSGNPKVRILARPTFNELQPYDIILPIKPAASVQEFAMVSDLPSGGAFVPEIVWDQLVSNTVLIAGINNLITSVIIATTGFYTFEFSNTIETTGAADISFYISQNGAQIGGHSVRRITTDQGGGGAQLKRHTLHTMIPNRLINAGVSINVVGNLVTGSGTSGQGSFIITKVGE